MAQFASFNKKYHIASFLVRNYELLHYYDNEYIVNDIDRYILEQGGDPLELSRAL